ncbi:hypothetical protein SNE40_023315 [Patella caerulea]
MEKQLAKLFCNLVIVLCIQHCGTVNLNTLRLTNVLYRHGDRSPVKIFKTDPNTISSWPQGFGYLSKIGMQEQYNLGKYFRERYNGFLNGSYIFSEIYVNSSNVDRCLMSAYSNLAGLYYPNRDEEWNMNITWQPIPVHTIPEPLDNMISLQRVCPKYDQLYQRSLKSPAVKKEEIENKGFYEFVSQKSGQPKESIDKIWQIADTLLCEQRHNKTWASWVNNTIYNKLRDLDKWSFDLLFGGRTVSRLKGGPILGQIVNNIQMKIAGQLNYKMMMYSGHDTTVAALLNAMKVFNQESPPYTATVIIELHEENNQYFVYSYYKNNTWPNTTSIHNLTLPGCDFRCPVDKFDALTKDSIPVDWEKECSIDQHGHNPLQFSEVAVTIMSILGGMVLLLTMIILVCQCRQNNTKTTTKYRLLEENGYQDS